MSQPQGKVCIQRAAIVTCRIWLRPSCCTYMPNMILMSLHCMNGQLISMRRQHFTDEQFRASLPMHHTYSWPCNTFANWTCFIAHNKFSDALPMYPVNACIIHIPGHWQTLIRFYCIILRSINIGYILDIVGFIMTFQNFDIAVPIR